LLCVARVTNELSQVETWLLCVAGT
jgi:hypothetical protein